MSSMGESGALVRALVEYLLSDEGQGLLADFSFEKLPTSLIEKGRAAIAAATYAADVDVWEFESAAKTQAYNGAKGHIFSGKRQNWDQYVLGGVVDSIGGIDDLGIEHASFDDRLAALEAKLITVTSASTAASNAVADNDDAADPSGIAIVALVLVLVLGLGAGVTIMKLQHRIGVLERVGSSSSYETGSQKGLVLNSGPI